MIYRPQRETFLGLDRRLTTLMLTGENETVASAVVEHLGIYDFRAGMLPAHKVETVRQLRSEGRTVELIAKDPPGSTGTR